jgi:hypothetical protein
MVIKLGKIGHETPTHLKDIKLTASSDNGNEMKNEDVERVMAKYKVKHSFGIPGRPMSQSLAQSHVGV